MRVLPRENDIRQFFRDGGFSGNPEKYAFNHYRSLLGNTEWVGAGKGFVGHTLTDMFNVGNVPFPCNFKENMY